MFRFLFKGNMRSMDAVAHLPSNAGDLEIITWHVVLETILIWYLKKMGGYIRRTKCLYTDGYDTAQKWINLIFVNKIIPNNKYLSYHRFLALKRVQYLEYVYPNRRIRTKTFKSCHFLKLQGLFFYRVGLCTLLFS